MTLTSAPKAHLVANDLVHGDLKDDQYFVGPAPAREVFLGDFGTRPGGCSARTACRCGWRTARTSSRMKENV